MCNDLMVRRRDAEILVFVKRMNQVCDGKHDVTVHLADVFVQLVYVIRLPDTPRKRTVHGWQ